MIDGAVFPGNAFHPMTLFSHLDASNVYGSDEQHAQSLRDRVRGQGLLRTGLLQTTDGKHLLPFNIDAPMDCQVSNSPGSTSTLVAGG